MLETGTSDETVSRNIARLVASGWNHQSAVRFAFSKAGRSLDLPVRPPVVILTRFSDPAPGTPVPGIRLTKFPGIAAFKPGKWNGEDFSPQFVKALYDNYRRFAQPGKNGQPWYVPYISIAHDEFPHLAGFRFGSLENAAIDRGGVLRFDADGVPEEVARLVKSGMLAHPSIEFVRPKRDQAGNLVSGFAGPDGKIVDGPVVKCLTFLGNDVPGVKGSEPLPEPVYSARKPLPVTSFAFVGGVLSRFSSDLPEVTMNRDQILAALQQLGLDTSAITADVPDVFLQTLLAWAQQQTGGQTQADPPAVPVNPAPTTMADNLTTPAGGITIPQVTTGQPGQTQTGQPSQVVLKFNQQFPGLLTGFMTQLQDAAKKATDSAAVADRTVSRDKERVIEALFRECDIDGTAQITVAMQPVIREQLMGLDHVAVSKFADANLAKFNGGKAEGTALERMCAQIKATYPVQAKQGRHPIASGGAATPTVRQIDPERRNRILSGSPEGRAALKKLGAAGGSAN